jgi:hypothetical protein
MRINNYILDQFERLLFHAIRINLPDLIDRIVVIHPKPFPLFIAPNAILLYVIQVQPSA